MISGEKLVMDYTTRKKELTSKGIVRCPKCNLIGLKSESEKYTRYNHKVYSTPIGAHRLEGCVVRK